MREILSLDETQELIETAEHAILYHKISIQTLLECIPRIAIACDRGIAPENLINNPEYTPSRIRELARRYGGIAPLIRKIKELSGESQEISQVDYNRMNRYLRGERSPDPENHRLLISAEIALED